MISALGPLANVQGQLWNMDSGVCFKGVQNSLSHEGDPTKYLCILGLAIRWALAAQRYRLKGKGPGMEMKMKMKEDYGSHSKLS